MTATRDIYVQGLRDAGYEGAYPDMLYAYLVEKSGITEGALNDLLKKAYLTNSVNEALLDLNQDAEDGFSLISAYATWNPLDKGNGYTISNNDKTITRTGSTGNTSVRATLPKTTGKWYFEITWPNGIPVGDGALALASDTTSVLETYPGGVPDSFLYYALASLVPVSSPRFSCSNLPYLLTGNAGTCLMAAIDVDGLKAWFGQDGTWFSGNPTTGVNPLVTWSASFPICITQRLYTTGTTCTLNTGQTPFNYTPPSGFNKGWYE